ncbi:DUF685 domain-containing protein [Borrelia hispanica]|uniref:DUF685 domain-containing protein n=1 Tax=Borrelia hispanica TaxID=40835 RepID=UPI0004656A49|nr:DUF685 domain-containing protein [Borrelia hispanica]
MDSILSKVTNKLEYDLSQQDTLNKNTYFLGLYYSSLKKIKVQEHLTGISEDFYTSSTSTIQPRYKSYSNKYSETIDMNDLKRRHYIFDFSDSSQENQNAEIIIETSSSYDDKPIYLNVQVRGISSSTSQASKTVKIQYKYSSSSKNIFWLSSVNGGTGLRLNILEGWYMQKRVDDMPLLLKL